MKLTSSQRWAVGAVGLAVLIACSPQAPDESPVPKPNEPTLSSVEQPPKPALAIPQ